METLAAWMDLPPSDAALVLGAVFLAAVVRGFTGFAMSALIMASAATVLPPVALIPILAGLEVAASLSTLKGGVRDFDRRVVIGLTGGSLIGWPVGLALTQALPVDGSRMIALSIIACLAALQLARVRIAFLATGAGLWSAGAASGVIGGLAAVGGMVVALYVLSQRAAPAAMRASLIIYLLASSTLSVFVMAAFDMIDATVLSRMAILTAPTIAGVLIGARLFSPRLQKYYRPACLTLLLGLAGVGLGRMTL